MPSIKLRSSDGEIFEVDVEIAKQSVTTMLEDLGMDDEGDDYPAPLPNVNAAVLKKVIQCAPTTRMIHLPLRTMRTRKNEQMTSLYGTKNS
ncbi:unnamed protein product [Caretta caretta]